MSFRYNPVTGELDLFGTNVLKTLTEDTLDGGQVLDWVTTDEDILYTKAGQPALDLQFASSKSLVDNVSGQNLVDFTRASGGTYVGSDGLIKNSAVNLLTYSEQFDDASWINSGSLITANTGSAPDGTTTADTLASSATAVYKTFSCTAQPYTASVFVKDINGGTVSLRLLGGGAGLDGGVEFDFSTNTAAAYNTVDTVSSQEFGNGWYRITATLTASGSASPQFRLILGGGGSCYIWGAQLEQASTVGEYVKTTSSISGAPRFDHDPATGESLGLLVEEQRTNLLKYSEAFENAAWVPLSGGTGSNPVVTANYAIAPNGLLQADRLQADRGAGNSVSDQSVLQNTVTSLTNPHSVILSVWMKSNTGVNQEVYFRNVTGAGGSLKTVTPEWQRFMITSSSVALSSETFQIGTRGTINTDNAIDILIWGAQIEVGAFPTSYIPTTSAAVTRSADVVTITGANFSSWYSQSQGTVFVDTIAATGSDTFGVLSFNASGSANNRIDARLSSVSLVTTGGTDVATLNNSLTQVGGQVYKTALAYALDDYGKSTNGSTVATDTSGALPVGIDQLDIGSVEGRNIPVNQPIRRLTYFNRRLSDATLQTITA